MIGKLPGVNSESSDDISSWPKLPEATKCKRYGHHGRLRQATDGRPNRFQQVRGCGPVIKRKAAGDSPSAARSSLPKVVDEPV